MPEDSKSNQNMVEQKFPYERESTKIFDFKLTQGNADDALVKPNTAIVSKSTALRYFGTDQVIGKLFKVDDRLDLEITGVFEDLPSNITLDGNVYVSFATSFFSRRPTWSNASLETYILATKGTSQSVLKSKLQQMLDKHVEKESQWYALNVHQMIDLFFDFAVE